MNPMEIALQKERVLLKNHIEVLQKMKEKITIDLAQLTASKLQLQITNKAPELLARIETHIAQGNQYEMELTQRIASRKNLYQRLPFFTQTNDPLPARSESVSDSPSSASSSLSQEIADIEKRISDIMTFK